MGEKEVKTSGFQLILNAYILNGSVAFRIFFFSVMRHNHKY